MDGVVALTKEAAGLHENSRRWDHRGEEWPTMRWFRLPLKPLGPHSRRPSQFYPAGVSRVHLDWRVAQLVGEMDGE